MQIEEPDWRASHPGSDPGRRQEYVSLSECDHVFGLWAFLALGLGELDALSIF